jgi:hypothetical protein
MSDSENFRQYASDCIDLAASMNGKDRQTMLAIAEAWKERAAEAKGRESNPGGRTEPDGPDVIPDAGA